MMSKMFTVINVIWWSFLITSSTTNGQGQSQGQQFVKQPQSAVVVKGQLAILECVVQNLVGNVQWVRGGFGLGLGPTFDGFPRYRIDTNAQTGQYNLVIANAQLEDDDDFQCQVSATDTTSGLQSAVAHLTVEQPPQSVTIDTGDQKVDIVANSTHTLQCVAAGARPAASLSWRLVSAESNLVSPAEMVAVQTDGKLSTTTGSLTVRPTIDDSGSRYSCVATNNATGVSAPVVTSVLINVVYAPIVAIAATPSDNLKEFDRVVFSCSSQANPSSVTWQWYIGDELQSGEQDTSLVIASIARQLINQSVSCVASNGVGSGRGSTSVSMTYGPRFLSAPVDQSADLGASLAALTCNVDSNPPASIEWTPSGSPVPVLARTTQLTFSPVTLDSFRTYTCTATVNGYAPISADVRLLMNGPPTVFSDSIQSAFVGGMATLDCLVSATPQAYSITWMKDGQAVDLNTQTRYSIKEENTTAGTHSRLTISGVMDSDFGLFNCTGINNYGSASSAVTFSKRESIPVTYILAGVIPGVVIIFIIAAIVFACHRRRSLGSELGSDNSESQMTKHVCETAHEDQDHHLDLSNGRYQNPSQTYEPSSGAYSVRSMTQHYDSWGMPLNLPPLFPTVKRVMDISDSPPDGLQSFSRKTYPANFYRGDSIRSRPDYGGSPQSAVSLVDDERSFQYFGRDQPLRSSSTVPEERIIRLATNV